MNLYRTRLILIQTRRASEAYNSFPRLRFGLVRLVPFPTACGIAGCAGIGNPNLSLNLSPDLLEPAAIEAFPDALDLRLNYGQFLLEQNDLQRAESVFVEAVVREPQNVLAHTGLGLALFQQNRPETIARALEHFRQAVELSPGDPQAN